MIGRLFFLIFLLQEKMEKLFLEENGETGNTQRESAKSTLQIPQENQKKSRESYPSTSSSSSVSRSQKTLGACLLSLRTRSPNATPSIAGAAKGLSSLRRLGLPRPFAAPFPRALLPRFVTPPSPAAPSGSSEMAMASARRGKETTGELERKGKSRPAIGDGETWRTSFSVLFISFLRPALGAGARRAVWARTRRPRRRGEILAVPVR